MQEFDSSGTGEGFYMTALYKHYIFCIMLQLSASAVRHSFMTVKGRPIYLVTHANEISAGSCSHTFNRQ